MQKPTTQKDCMGCGIACVAHVCRMNYTSAKRLFRNTSNAKTKGFICKDLVSALLKAGKQYGYRYVNQRKKWKSGTIVFIKRSNRYPGGHYLARTSDCWMDPWKNFTQNKNITRAKAGFRKRLPGRPIYEVFPSNQRLKLLDNSA